MHSDSRIAKISSTLGLAAVALLLIGPTLCQFGAAPMTGFSVFGLGLLARSTARQSPPQHKGAPVRSSRS